MAVPSNVSNLSDAYVGSDAPLPEAIASKPRQLWLVLFACALAVLAGSIIWFIDGPYDVDDAPITYRYAENIASGQGYVYNTGERIQGTSTPLYTLVLAVLRLAGAPTDATSNVLNLFSSSLVVLLVFLTTHRLSKSPWISGLAAVGYLLLQGTFMRYTMAGMETPLYTLFIVAALYVLTFDKSVLAAAFAALALLTRLDGAALAVAVFGTLLLQRRRIPWRELMLYAAMVVPWFAFAWVYFGWPFPNSMMAKMEHLRVGGRTRFWLFHNLLGSGPLAPAYPFAFVLPGTVQIASNPKFTVWIAAPLLWLAAYCGAYLLVGIEFYEWYLAPIYPVAAILIGSGVGSLAGLLVLRLPRVRESFAQIAHWVLVIIVLWLLALPLWFSMKNSIVPWNLYLQEIEGSRVRAAEWLRAHADPDSSVYTRFIGHLGFGSGLHLIDGMSLVTPNGSARMGEADYIVTNGFPRIAEECGVVAEFDVGHLAYGLQPTAIGQCNGEAIAEFEQFRLEFARLASQLYNGTYNGIEEGKTLLEFQWTIAEPVEDEEWQVYVHFADAAGNTLDQADHALGRQADGSIRALDQWDPARRTYTYAELPDRWPEIESAVSTMRVGIRNPVSGERLAPLTYTLTVDQDGSIVIPMPTRN